MSTATLSRAKSRTTRDRSPIDYHDVMIALSKARAAATLADVCGHGSDYLQLEGWVKPKAVDDEDEIREWIRGFAFDALARALDEAGAAFRKSLVPEQAEGSR